MLASFRRFALAGAAVGLALGTLGANHARAQANLAFSGGNGGLLTLTLGAPVTYAVTTVPSGGSPFFVFRSVGNSFPHDVTVSGTLFFTVDGGAMQTFTTINSGVAGGSVAATDAYIFGSIPGVVVGDVVVLDAGTLTTSANFAGAAPSNGSYQTFLIDGAGTKLDAVNGVAAAPEPATWVLLGVGLAGLGLRLRRPRRA